MDSILYAWLEDWQGKDHCVKFLWRLYKNGEFAAVMVSPACKSVGEALSEIQCSSQGKS